MDIIEAIFASGENIVLVGNGVVVVKLFKNGAILANGDWIIELEFTRGDVILVDVCTVVVFALILEVVDGVVVVASNSFIGLIWKSRSHKAGIPGSDVVVVVVVEVVLFLRRHLNLFPALFVGHLPKQL